MEMDIAVPTTMAFTPELFFRIGLDTEPLREGIWAQKMSFSKIVNSVERSNAPLNPFSVLFPSWL